METWVTYTVTERAIPIVPQYSPCPICHTRITSMSNLVVVAKKLQISRMIILINLKYGYQS